MNSESIHVEEPKTLRARLGELQWLQCVLVFFVVLLLSVFLRSYDGKFLTPEAMDIAQLGRNIADGKGFTTDYLRPLLLNLPQMKGGTPDLSNSPLYPLLTGCVFAVLGDSDWIIRLLSHVIFAGTALLLFLLVKRLVESGATAALTVAVYALSEPVLTRAGSGTPIVLSTFLLLAVLLKLTPTSAEDNAEGVSLPRTYLLAGALAGLCYLSEFLSVLYVLPLAFLWTRGLGRLNWKNVLYFTAGFCALAGFWWLRNFRLTGNPFYSAQWLELDMFTDRFPDLSLYRELDKSNIPSIFLYSPGLTQMGSKVLRGLLAYFYQFPMVPHMYLMPFIFLAYWSRSTSSLWHEIKRGTIVGAILYVIALSALGRISASLLMPLAPLLSYLGVMIYRGLWREWLERQLEVEAQERMKEGEASRSKVIVARYGFLAALVLAILFPLGPMVRNTVSRPPFSSVPAAVAQDLKGLPLQSAVITDIPLEVAWYGRRPAVALPNQVSRIPKVISMVPAGSILLTSHAPKSIFSSGAGGEWASVLQDDKELPAFNREPLVGTRDVVYHRLPSVSEAQKMVLADGKHSAPQVALGRAFLRDSRSKEALVAFQKAATIDNRDAQAWLGIALVLQSQGNMKSSLDPINRSLALQPRFLPAQMALANAQESVGQNTQAITTYEQILADTPDNTIAANNLADLYARVGTDLYRAMELARRSVGSNPQTADTWDTLGWVTYRLGRYKEATFYLVQAAKLNAVPDTLARLGLAAQAAGNKPLAEQALTQAQRGVLTPENKQAVATALGKLD